MSTLTLEGVPETLREELERDAARRGQTVSEVAVDRLSRPEPRRARPDGRRDDGGRRDDLDVEAYLARVRAHRDGMPPSLDIVEIIRAGRDADPLEFCGGEH